MKRKQASVSHRERLVEELKLDPSLAADYLNVAAEDGDAQSYLLALRTVAEAQGMAKVAKAAGVPRESMYRALSPKGNPRLSTLNAVLAAAGLKMTVATNVRQKPRAAIKSSFSDSCSASDLPALLDRAGGIFENPCMDRLASPFFLEKADSKGR